MKYSFEDKGQQMMHRLGGRTSYTQSHSHALLLLGWVLRILNFPLFSSAFLWESEAFQFVAKIHAKKQQQQPPVQTNQPTEDLPPLADTLLVSQAATVHHFKPLVQHSEGLLFSALPF